jgi:thioredoxin reductase
MSADDHARLKSFNIEIRDQNIAALNGDKDAKQLSLILFSDNSVLDCDALFFNLGSELAIDLHEKLGCKLDEECGLIWVDQTQQTSVAGVYAAGDITPNSRLRLSPQPRAQ